MIRLEERAKALAIYGHRNQKYNGNPYFYHIEEVVDNLQQMGYIGMVFADYRIVGYLHDLVEDTDITLTQIEKEFGSRIAHSVDCISRRKEIIPIDANNEHVVKETEQDYLARVASNRISTAVKWADANANLLNCAALDAPSHKKRLYKKYLRTLEYLAQHMEME